MKRAARRKIFATIEAADLIGREAEFERLIEHRNGNGGIVLLASPLAGVSELMRQVFDSLFFGQDEQVNTVPFYFEFRATDLTADAAAVRFVKEFLTQTVAFRRRDPGIIEAAPEICEVAELAVPADGHWIDRVVDTCHSDSKLNDELSFIKNCFSAPRRAAADGTKSVVLIDALHVLRELAGGDALFEDLVAILTRSSLPFVAGGLRRSLHGMVEGEAIRIEGLSFPDAGALAENLSALRNVEINDQTRDLIAVQLSGNPGRITSLFGAAADKRVDLTTFASVEQIYTDEIFGGKIGMRLDKDIRLSAVADPEMRMAIVCQLAENAERASAPADQWTKRLGNSAEKILHTLHINEIVNFTSGEVVINPGSVIRDYLASRVALEIDKEPRALAVGEALTANIRRAPMLMAELYRRNASLGLREILLSFAGQPVATLLLDHATFKLSYKGLSDEEALSKANAADERLDLPQIVYAADTASFYPQFRDLIEPERSAVGISATGDRHAWLAAEIDSKLEATRELTEFWCDRLEMAALSCGFENYRIWLIAPEGFSDEALGALGERNAYGSSRKQVELLAHIIGSGAVRALSGHADEYEITIPMGEDTEIIAANTIEEIAKRHRIPKKTINQIKTAIVEACINATEHSLSPDRKINQKIAVTTDKIVITITNRGLRLADKPLERNQSEDARRGWGLKLMSGLMDDVKIEQTDDGTRITMIKAF